MSNRFAMASGRLIDIANFKEEDICLEDIAHHLAKIQRFNGSLPINSTYSIAEHCINLYAYLKKGPYFPIALANVLLHDASEAYLSDVVSPVKSLLPDYLNLEQNIQAKIYKKYLKFDVVYDDWISIYDKRILMDEVETIMPHRLELFKQETGLEKLGCHIEYNNDPRTIKAVFLSICRKLKISD